MAAQLTPGSPFARLQQRLPLALSQRAMLGALTVVVALGMLGLLAGLRDARRDEQAARARFADAQALVALPPASTDSIEEDLVAVNHQLATAEAHAAAPPSAADPRDAAVALLVHDAQAAGLAVKGLSQVAAGRAKVGDNVFDTQGIRMTVDGEIGEITGFLGALTAAQPSLIPSLTTMTISADGSALAEFVFSTFSRVVAPTPVPVATPKGAKR